jgi:hypothetical protein
MNLQEKVYFLALQVVAEVSGCHSALKTSAPVVLGTVPLISYQPAFAPVPIEGGDMSGGIGWTVLSRGSEPPPHVQPNVPPQEEPYCIPSAPPLGEEEYKQKNMPFYGPTAPFSPDIRMYK